MCEGSNGWNVIFANLKISAIHANGRMRNEINTTIKQEHNNMSNVTRDEVSAIIRSN